jgi:hypothetical protein
MGGWKPNWGAMKGDEGKKMRNGCRSDSGMEDQEEWTIGHGGVQ